MSETGFAQWQFKDSYPMYLAEFIGTMLYAMTFSITTESQTIYEPATSSKALAINESYFIAPIAVGFIVIAMIYAFGHISGAHFNPVNLYYIGVYYIIYTHYTHTHILHNC